MSTTVDQRVVEMRFDNKQFESNVSTTMSTLDKLKQSLNLTGATKGLENIDSAAKKVDMSPLKGAVETVGLKFNAMYTIADQALRNITNSAMNAGQRIISALTIDPIKMGFSEYETQMNAVQTILANTESKGKTLDDVNNALDELNTYADKTIYNFTEMTRNIGTFTAAGVDLDTSVASIKGIANLAAVSGSTSQQASTAMYQLSQAMASGTVKLMDWNSVVNAGMGGQVFQDALKETAKVHGVAIDDIIKKQGSFRESLSEGWLTTEILTETLSKFTGDLTEDQLKSMGYTEEQIKGIVKMGQTANDAATKVKTVSQLFDTLKEAAQSGWTQTWEIIVGDFEEAKEFLTEVSDTIGAMIGSSAEARNELLENWKVLGGRTALIDSIRNAFEGVMSIVKPIKEAFREIFPPMTAEKLMGFTEGLKNLTAKLKIGETTSENLKRTFKGLFAVVDIVKQAFGAVFNAVGSLLGGVGELGGGVLGVTASFGDWLVKLRDAIKSSDIFNRILKGVVDVVKAAAGGVKSFYNFIKEKLIFPGLELFQNLLGKTGDRMSGLVGIASKMKDGIIAAFDAIGSFLESCSFFKMLEGIWKAIKLIAGGLIKAFGAITKGIANMFGNADFSSVFDLINSLITGGILLKVIQFLKGFAEPLEDMKGLLDGFLGNITGVLEGLGGCLEGFQSRLKAEALMKIAGAIAILTAALLVLSLIDSEKLATAIGVMTTLFIELSASLGVISKFSKGTGIVKVATSMMTLSMALLILAAALKIMSSIPLSNMGVGLLGIAGGLAVLVIAVNLLPEKKVNSAATAIKKMSTALLILAVAMKIMGSISWEEMKVGLVTVGASLGMLVLAVNLLPDNKVTSAAKAIKSMSTALLILSIAVKIMSTMSWQEMGIGLISMAAGLAALVLAVNLLPKDTALKAVGMVALAMAMVILAGALKIMATMSWQEMGVGLVTLGGAMLILAVGLNVMQSALPGALALIVAAGALAILAPVIILLGTLSWQTVVQGLLTIAGAFAIVGIAGVVLLPVVPAILALAGAIALIGVGTLAAGLGLMAFGAGLTAIAVGFTAIFASLSAIVTGIIALVSAVVTGILKGIADGIIAFCNIIIQGAPAICEALTVVITSLCDAIVASVPAIINCIDVLLTALLNFIVDFVPKLVDAGLKLIIGLLEGIAANIGGVISAAVDVVIAFINGIAEQIPKVIQAGVDLMLDFINGLADGIRNNTPRVLAAVNNLMSAIFEAIGMAIGNIGELGRQIVQGFANGIKNSASKAVNAAKEMAGKVWGSIKSFFGIKSPSRLAAEGGMYIDEGLAVGLKKFASVAGDAAVDVGKETMNSLSDAVSGASDIVNGSVSTNPTIRPVIDLSDVKKGANAISDMLDIGSSVDVLGNVGAINSAMSRRNQNGGNDDVVSAINKLGKELENAGGTTYNINGVSYEEGSDVGAALQTIVRAIKIERRSN